jgi:hypothetical protein
MVVAITALVASIGHVISFAQQGSEVLDLVLSTALHKYVPILKV